MVLTQEQAYRSMEQNQEHRNKPMSFFFDTQSSVLFSDMSILHWASTQMWQRNPQPCPSRQWVQCTTWGGPLLFTVREERKGEMIWTHTIPNSCSGIWVTKRRDSKLLKLVYTPFSHSGGLGDSWTWATVGPVSYTHLTLPTTGSLCRSRWSPYH